MNRREEVLWEIAERYHDLVDPLNGPASAPGTGEVVALMPRTYTSTVREFERLLGVMRNQAKQKAFRGASLGKLRWHVLEYHINAVRTIKHEPATHRKNGKGGKVVTLRSADGTLALRPVIRYARHKDAREQRARDGIAWIAENWALGHEPMLPQEILAAAA